MRVTVEAGQTIEVGQVILHYTPARASRSPDQDPTRRALGVAKEQRVGDGERPCPSDPADRQVVIGRLARPATCQAAPAVRRHGPCLGIDLGDVPASGPAGRVLIDDLSAFVRTWQDRDPASRRRSNRSNAMDLGTPGQRIKLQGVRRSIAEHMVMSKKTIPHYSYIDECNVTEMVALRNELKRPLYAEDVKLTSLPFLREGHRGRAQTGAAHQLLAR